MSTSELRPDDSHLDLSRLLEQHLLAGFPPDLALDLVFNEIVVRAAEATRASAAALALARGDEMVCRAATGHLAPALGVPLNPRDGLSVACLQTRQPQLSVDTEFDPRVDPTVSRRLGIRSILIVPVFDSNDTNAQFAGVLEVFSRSPAAFSHTDQMLLEGFAEECARVRHGAIELGKRKPAAAVVRPKLVPSEFIPSDFSADTPLPARRPPYEAWTLVLGSLVILATIAVSLLIGSRIGWLRPPQTASSIQITQPITANSIPEEPMESAAATKSAGKKLAAKRLAPAAPAKSTTADSAEGELVVYEKGKVIFRMQSPPTKPDQAQHHQAEPDSTQQANDSIVKASSTTKIAPSEIATTEIATSKSVWLSPEKAENRLLSRTEPQYPAEALATHRAGNVVLNVQVAKDGSVSSTRTLRGDPLLAAAAADAVRNWRYQPYRLHGHPAQFQTDVTLSFALPD